MGLYSRMVRRLAGRRWFAVVGSRLAPVLDRTVHRLSGGRRLVTPESVPTLLLTTTGRRTGRSRTVPLSFVSVEGIAVVVGTNWGLTRQPDWALNLLVDPQARVTDHRDQWDVEAVPIPEVDRADIWPLFDAMLPAFRSYRARLHRPIHMFRLERV